MKRSRYLCRVLSRLKRSFMLELVVLLAASIPLLAPLLAPGYLRGDDAAYTPWRALELLEALKGGVLFPRWSQDLFYGYGFPLFNYYSPLSLYQVVVLSGFGLLSLLTASKLAFGIDLLLAGVGGMVLGRTIGLGRLAALAAGILYMYSPHTAREVYLRSGLPTIAALALLPFVLAAFVRLAVRKNLVSVALCAFLVLAAVLIHNLTSVLTLGMTTALSVVHFWKVRDSRALSLSLVAVLLGLGLSSFFLVPALADLRLSHTESLAVEDLDFHNYFVDPLGGTSALLASRVADKPNGIPTSGPIDLHIAYPYESLPVKLGFFQGLLMALSVGAILAHKRLNSWLLAVALTAVVLYYLHSCWSQWLWEHFPILPPFQYPWRMLGPMGLCIALLGAWALSFLAGKKRLIAVALVLSATMIAGRWGLPTELGPLENGLQLTRQDVALRDYQDRSHLGTMTYAQFLPLSVQWDRDKLKVGDLLPRYDKYYPPERWVDKTAFLQLDVRGWISAARSGQQWMEARVQADEPLMVAFHTVYFPGWTGYVDGKQVPIEPTSWQTDDAGRPFALGICQVPVPAGDHLVRIQFENTPLRFWSSLASLVSLLIVGALLFVAIRRRYGWKVAPIIGPRSWALPTRPSRRH